MIDPASGIIKRLGELEERRPFFVGVAVIEPEALAHLPDRTAFEFVPEILRPAVESGRAGAYLTEGLWFDVGSPALWYGTHIRLLKLLSKGTLPSLWSQRIIQSASRVEPGHIEGQDWSADLSSGVVSYGTAGSLDGPLLRYDGLEVRIA